MKWTQWRKGGGGLIVTPPLDESYAVLYPQSTGNLFLGLRLKATVCNPRSSCQRRSDGGGGYRTGIPSQNQAK